MAWPVISQITEAVKSLGSSEEAPESQEPDAPAETTEDTTPPSSEETPEAEPKQPEPEAPSDPITFVAEQLKKDPKAFLASLPEEARESFRSAEYKALHQTLSRVRNESADRQKESASMIAKLEQKFEDTIEELLTTGMSEEEKRTRKDKRDLEQLRAEKTAPEPAKPISPEKVSAMVAETPFADAFWSTVKEMGLPVDPSNTQVRDLYTESLLATRDEKDVYRAIDVMRSIAPKYRPKATPEPRKVPTDDEIEARVDALVKKKLKESLLTADTGKPGASGGTSQPKTYADARKQSEELLRSG